MFYITINIKVEKLSFTVSSFQSLMWVDRYQVKLAHPNLLTKIKISEITDSSSYKSFEKKVISFSNQFPKIKEWELHFKTFAHTHFDLWLKKFENIKIVNSQIGTEFPNSIKLYK